MTGVVEAIWVKRFKKGPMDAVAGAELVAGRGILGNANQAGRRQVTIIAAEAWEAMLAELGASLAPSARRANVLVRGIPLARTRGMFLDIGPCRLEIRGETRPCERMDEALPGLRAAMGSEWRGGVFAEVLRGGRIRVGDAVTLLDPNIDLFDRA